MAPRRVHLRITGLVLRAGAIRHTLHEAQRLGVRGWVRNLPEGNVEAMAEAEPEVLEGFLAWCRKGPRSAKVRAVDVTEAPIDVPFTHFEVRR
jgi:acylphosphatase